MDACTAGSGTDTIAVPAGTYTLTIAGTAEDAAATGDLDLSSKLTITGAGPATTIIDGNQLDRVFDVLSDAEVTIAGLTIQNGQPIVVEQPGGGILNNGTLALNNVIVQDNRTTGDGGGIANNGRLTISSSTIRRNLQEVIEVEGIFFRRRRQLQLDPWHADHPRYRDRR